MKLAPLSYLKRKLNQETKGGKKKPRQQDCTPKKLPVNQTKKIVADIDSPSRKTDAPKKTVSRHLDFDNQGQSSLLPSTIPLVGLFN